MSAEIIPRPPALPRECRETARPPRPARAFACSFCGIDTPAPQTHPHYAMGREGLCSGCWGASEKAMRAYVQQYGSASE